MLIVMKTEALKNFMLFNPITFLKDQMQSYYPHAIILNFEPSFFHRS